MSSTFLSLTLTHRGETRRLENKMVKLCLSAAALMTSASACHLSRVRTPLQPQLGNSPDDGNTHSNYQSCDLKTKQLAYSRTTGGLCELCSHLYSPESENITPPFIFTPLSCHVSHQWPWRGGNLRQAGSKQEHPNFRLISCTFCTRMRLRTCMCKLILKKFTT